MKKRIFAFLIACMMILSTAVCAFAEEVEEFGGYDKTTFQESSESLITDLFSFDDATLTQYITYYEQYGQTAYLDFFNQYAEMKESMGAVQSFGTFTMETDQDGNLVTILPVVCEGGSYDFEVCFTLADGAPSMTTLRFLTEEEDNTSFGAKMKTAAMNTLLGMGTVFAVLIFISFLISLFKYIGGDQKKAGAPKEEVVVSANADDEITAVLMAAVQASQQDEQLVAVIAASIAAATGTGTDSFVVRSIRRRV